MGTHRIGRIRMSPELLLEILDLDREHRIVAVRDNRGCFDQDRRAIEIIVAGPKMPEVKISEVAPSVEATYRKKDYELVDVQRVYGQSITEDLTAPRSG
jgi:hypothetical protein